MRLIESICIENGEPQRLAVHQERVDRAFMQLFPGEAPLHLTRLFQSQQLPGQGIHKARLVYTHAGISEFTIEPYGIRPHRRIGLVEAPGFQYPHKFEDRRFFQSLFRLHPTLDDFIILHGGLLTDSTYCNLALHDGTGWYTPATCLLPGIRRHYYMKKGIVHTARIEVGQLRQYKRIAFINAMRGLETAQHMEDLEFVAV